MTTRVVRVEQGYWRIRTDLGELSESETEELKKYFDEIEMPYSLIENNLCVNEEISQVEIFGRLEHFYEDRADVLPF